MKLIREYFGWVRRVQSGIHRGIGIAWRWLLDGARDLSRQAWQRILLGLGVFFLLWYGLGMGIMHRVDDRTDFANTIVTPEGQSHTVAIITGLLDREVNDHGWVMNDPFFMPSALLDNMPNYQSGMFSALARVTIEFRDQIGRTRGSSSEDADLQVAAGLLPYPGDVWIFNFSTSILPTASAESQYNRARRALTSYNDRLSRGEAIFERRSDNLMATLDRMALDVGASSAALEAYIDEHSGNWIDFGSDDLFYNIKGQSYGYLMVLEGLRVDFAAIISRRELSTAFDQLIVSFRTLAALDPLIVFNNEVDDIALPNHLAAQGFYQMRARTQLREITNILLK